MNSKSLLYLILTLLLTTLSTFSAIAEQSNSSPIGGADHIGLTVSNLEKSKAFFTNTLGFNELGKDPSYPAYFLNNGEITVTLWQAEVNAKPFDRKNNVGLHHLAFRVSSLEKLNALYKTLQTSQGVVIEFAPENLGNGPAKHMMIREPSGNRLEFIHRAKR